MYLCFCLLSPDQCYQSEVQGPVSSSRKCPNVSSGKENKKNTTRMREGKKCSPFSFFPLHIRKTLTRYVHVSLFSFKYRRNLGGLNSLLEWTQNTSVNLIPQKQIGTLLSSHLLFFLVFSHRTSETSSLNYNMQDQLHIHYTFFLRERHQSGHIFFSVSFEIFLIYNLYIS